MPGTEEGSDIEELRVYSTKAGRTDVFLASDAGLVRVAVSGDKIGEFGIVDRGAVRDVAVLPDAATDRLAVATDEDVRVGDAGAEPTLAATGFGPAVAVGAHDGDLLAAGPEGSVGRLPGGDPDADWDDLGDAGEARAISGPLVATADGVVRVVGDGLSAVGLGDVRDVAGAGVPLAAAADGLYWLGNGWLDALDGAFDAVAADGAGNALAAGDGTYVHEGDAWDADAWTETALPVDDAAVALAYGPGVAVAVTAAGTVCVDAGDGWRHRTVGVRDVRGVAVAGGE